MSFKSILYPTDFSEQSMVAFRHALKLALEQRAKLIWGLIDKNASRKDIYDKLGVEIQKVIGKGENIIGFGSWLRT